MLRSFFYFCTFFLFSSTLLAVSSEQASNHIEALHNRVKNELVGNLSLSTRQARFRSLLTQSFDLNKISRFVLGGYWQKASAQDQTNFKNSFEDYLVRSYANSFSNYGGNDFKVTNVKVNPNNTALVYTTVGVRKNGGGVAPANLVWRLKDYGGNLKIIDVTVENVSMSITKRNEFASILSGNGGQVNGLIQRIGQVG